MNGALAGEVLHLMAAGGARGDHDGAGLLVADGRQQLALSDRARDVEVIGRIAERSGHAATAGIEIDDGRAGNVRRAATLQAPAGPSISDGSGRGAESPAVLA